MLTNVENITITRSILHIINGSSSHYSNSLLPNTDNEFNAFLTRHIRSCVRTKSRKSALFLHKPNNDTYNYIESLFLSNDDFIQNSRILADELKAICTIKNSGPYDLIFCEYINEDDEKCIAIILLEFTTSFFHELRDSDAIIKRLTVLASSSSSFKKCALIPQNDTDYEYDFIINDKHNTEFFLNDFLNGKIFMDERKATETFIEQTILWVNEKINDPFIDINLKEKFENVKSQCISCINDNDTIDIDAFEDSVFRDDISQFKTQYNSRLEQFNLINKEIVLNNDITSEYKCQKIKLDTGIELKVPIAILDNAYESNYNRCITENGNTKFTLEGKVETEKVKSR